MEPEQYQSAIVPKQENHNDELNQLSIYLHGVQHQIHSQEHTPLVIQSQVDESFRQNDADDGPDSSSACPPRWRHFSSCGPVHVSIGMATREVKPISLKQHVTECVFDLQVKQHS